MNRADLAAHISTRTSMSKVGVDGFTVKIGGFATFSAKSRPVRRGRDPRTGQSTAMAATNAPAFKAGKAIRTALR